MIGLVALSAALAAPRAWSQVSLVSQNRFVQASSYYNPPTCNQNNQINAPGFSPFDQELTVQCPGADYGTAIQHSTVTPTRFDVQMSAGAGGNAPFSGSSATSSYQVVFDVIAPTPYTSLGSSGQFRLVGPGVNRLLDSTEDSVLAPGRYTLSCALTAVNPGGILGGFAQNTMTFAPVSAFTVDWSTIDGGGGTLNGGAFQISGTAGQPDGASRASRLSGGDFQIIGGFWTVTLPECGADFDGNGFANGDDFDAFVDQFIAGTDDADFDGNGFVTGDDYDAFVTAFEAGC